jgi:hypothetical protein
LRAINVGFENGGDRLCNQWWWPLGAGHATNPRRKHLANRDPIGGYRFSERDRAQQNKLRRTPKPQMLDLPELAVDAQLDAADREHFDPGFGFAGLDLVADPELPFPHSRDSRHRHRVFDASVIHGKNLHHD